MVSLTLARKDPDRVIVLTSVVVDKFSRNLAAPGANGEYLAMVFSTHDPGHFDPHLFPAGAQPSRG
jgi:hypothetical protein